MARHIVYRDLTGGLTDDGKFQAVYEFRGSGKIPFALGESVDMRPPTGEHIVGHVCDVWQDSKEWCVLICPEDDPNG